MKLQRHWLLTLLLSAVILAPASQASLLETNFNSSLIGLRTIRVCLPPSYATSAQRFPVLYLHDGQNVFSSAGTNAAFGWGNWELDRTAEKLARAGQMQEVILVAVDNAGWLRLAEYSGQHRATNSAAPTAYENYSAFLRQELKPWVDANFRTRPEATNTAVMGSSMGGLCSVVLAWEHPEVFGGAASLSGAFQMNRVFVATELKNFSGSPKPVKFYLDSGTVDFMGGDDGCALTREVAGELQRIGWNKNLILFTDANPLTPAQLEKSDLRREKWAEAQRSQHNEFYWRLRAERPLKFLFPPLR